MQRNDALSNLWGISRFDALRKSCYGLLLVYHYLFCPILRSKSRGVMSILFQMSKW